MNIQSNQAAERFQSLLEEFVETLGNLGAVAAIDIAGKGRHYFAAGYADLDRKKPAQPEMPFRIASQSKTVVAMTMLLLERNGVLTLDHSVQSYLDLPIDPRITVRHLLTNQCGLGETAYAMPASRWDPRHNYSPRDLVMMALPQGQLFDPGSRFDYCNTGWVIAAMIVEAVAHQPYGKVLHDVLLAPLGLKNSWFGGVIPAAEMLHGYLDTPVTNGFVDMASCLGTSFGAGDGIATLDDMLSLFSSLIDGKTSIGIQLADLTADLGQPAPEPYFPMSMGTKYGLGIERRAWAGSEVWGHPGSAAYAYNSGTWVDQTYGITISTCVTRATKFPPPPTASYAYPREQLFAQALSTAYTLMG